MKPRFGRRWRGSEAGRHEGGKYLAGTSRKGMPTSGLEPLTSSHYECTRFCCAGSSISGRPAPRILSAYVLCFILLDSRHCQRERWCVTWCIERLAVSSAPIPYRGLGIALRFTSKSSKRRADERTRTDDLLITSNHSGVAGVCRGLQIPH